jgi:hypothetical protein
LLLVVVPSGAGLELGAGLWAGAGFCPAWAKDKLAATNIVETSVNSFFMDCSFKWGKY